MGDAAAAAAAQHACGNARVTSRVYGVWTWGAASVQIRKSRWRWGATGHILITRAAFLISLVRADTPPEQGRVEYIASKGRTVIKFIAQYYLTANSADIGAGSKCYRVTRDSGVFLFRIQFGRVALREKPQDETIEQSVLFYTMTPVAVFFYVFFQFIIGGFIQKHHTSNTFQQISSFLSITIAIFNTVIIHCYIFVNFLQSLEECNFL